MSFRANLTPRFPPRKHPLHLHALDTHEKLLQTPSLYYTLKSVPFKGAEHLAIVIDTYFKADGCDTERNELVDETKYVIHMRDKRPPGGESYIQSS